MTPSLFLNGDRDVATGNGVFGEDGGQFDVLALLGGRSVVGKLEDQLDEAEDCTEGIGDLHRI